MDRSETEAKRPTLATVLFYLGFSGFIAHELDAVLHAEWRLLFVLRSLPDSTASSVFILLHIPLVAIILWLGNHPKDRVQTVFRLSFSLFLVVHGGLHFWLSDAPANLFDGIDSKLLIYATSAFGLSYVVACIRQRRGIKSSL